MTIKATLSPSIHEGTIRRHMKDDDDAVLAALHDGVRLAREMCEKASQTVEAVLDNQMDSEPQRHRRGREASFALIERATQKLDAAMKAAANEIKALQVRTHGPAPTRDTIQEQRHRELRERLAALPKDRQSAILAEAIGHDDDNLIGAILSVPSWIVAMTQTEQEMLRSSWSRKRYPAELDRMARIGAAIEDARRAGTQSIHFVDSLTNAELVVEAEKSERRSADALKAAKA